MTSLGIILLITIVISVIPNQAEAVSISLKGKGIGIIIEKPLLLSGKLKYSDLMKYDNSSAKYSGALVKSGDDVKREKSKYQNNLAFYYSSSKFTVFVDPPKAVTTQMPNIIIVSNLVEYHDTGQFKIMENKTAKNDIKATVSKRTYSTARFVDAGCFNAVIQYQNWQLLLPDTIQYLYHNCDPNYTKINTIIDEYHPITKHDLATSSKYKLEQFYDTVSKDCTKKRNACVISENRAVSTMGDSK